MKFHKAIAAFLPVLIMGGCIAEIAPTAEGPTHKIEVQTLLPDMLPDVMPDGRRTALRIVATDIDGAPDNSNLFIETDRGLLAPYNETSVLSTGTRLRATPTDGVFDFTIACREQQIGTIEISVENEHTKTMFPVQCKPNPVQVAIDDSDCNYFVVGSSEGCRISLQATLQGAPVEYFAPFLFRVTLYDAQTNPWIGFGETDLLTDSADATNGVEQIEIESDHAGAASLYIRSPAEITSYYVKYRVEVLRDGYVESNQKDNLYIRDYLGEYTLTLNASSTEVVPPWNTYLEALVEERLPTGEVRPTTAKTVTFLTDIPILLSPDSNDERLYRRLETGISLAGKMEVGLTARDIESITDVEIKVRVHDWYGKRIAEDQISITARPE